FMQDIKKQPEDYIGEIKGGLRPSMRLVVMGIVHKQPKSMVVTLSCSSRAEGKEEEEKGDVGLQLTVSFGQKSVLRNSRLAGEWGASESAISFFPFAAGESFKVKKGFLRSASWWTASHCADSLTESPS
uniref:Galectin n=1 Tax=Electrophorus electricus TaxID=8005 RepID=A0AAY5EW25_ELEEL